MSVTPDLLLDNIHAAWLAGYRQGFAKGQRFASMDLALAIVHAHAAHNQRAAVRQAYQRHGSEWAQAIFEQTQPP